MHHHPILPPAATLVALSLLAIRPVGGQERPPDPEVRNVIFMVADGAGVGHWTLARLARGEELAVASMPVLGLVDTRNAEGRITDSAAGGTAYATGHRSFNRGISLSSACRPGEGQDPEERAPSPDCVSLETVLERAEKMGKATGLVTTTAVTDATPAAFAAHVPSRDMDHEIARQMLAAGVDVILGGGRASFRSGDGGGDLLEPVCATADCPATAEELHALEPSGRRLVGLFAPQGMPRAGVRHPELTELTRTALERLSEDDDGFFVMVESEGTDTHSHGQDTMDAITAEIVAFDEAVMEALDFARRTPGTLLVVTADHETGGLAVQEEGDAGSLVVRYTSSHHTDAMVPLWAEGPGAAELAGVHDNEEVGRILMRLLTGSSSIPSPSRR